MIFAYRERHENGNYENNEGVRYIVHKASAVYGAKRACWQEFESIEAALEYWGLVPYEYPDEELLTEA